MNHCETFRMYSWLSIFCGLCMLGRDFVFMLSWQYYLYVCVCVCLSTAALNPRLTSWSKCRRLFSISEVEAFKFKLYKDSVSERLPSSVWFLMPCSHSCCLEVFFKMFLLLLYFLPCLLKICFILLWNQSILLL